MMKWEERLGKEMENKSRRYYMDDKNKSKDEKWERRHGKDE